MIVEFPSYAGKQPPDRLVRYYNTYYAYIRNMFDYRGFDLVLDGDTAVADGAFTMKVDGRQIVIDYSDHLRVVQGYGLACYKYHYSDPTPGVKNEHRTFKNYLYPFPPVSFYDWAQYYKLQEEIEYRCVGRFIINRQKCYGNAEKRREEVQKRMAALFGRRFQRHIIPQVEFWRDVGRCMVAVFVPGCRNDMLDRGHLQYLAFGCCTISPPIINVLPWYRKLVPGEHYIQCRPDYSDLEDLILWVEDNRSECMMIGQNAKRLFQQTCTPKMSVKWILKTLEGIATLKNK